MTERSGMSRRQALMCGGAVAAVPLLTAMRPAGKTRPMSQQDNWRWCWRCQGLWFAGNESSACPAGGFHGKWGSGDYTLNLGTGSGQDDWWWCDQCEGLWFAGNGTTGVCPGPAGGGHSSNGSADYFLTQGSGSGQSGWRWCERCQGLWFGGNGTAGVCPAGGGHSESGSGDYFIPQQPEPPTFEVLVNGSGFAFDGFEWIPQTTVQITYSFNYGDGSLQGGPYAFVVGDSSAIRGTIGVDYAGHGGTVLVQAVDPSSGQSASASGQIWTLGRRP